MNVVFAINKSYITQLGTCLTSILENNQKEFFKFYILHSELTEQNYLQIYSLKRKYNNFNIILIKIDKESVKNLKINIDYISKETYYRYFIANLLDEDKCLYLDADTIVKGNIVELYNTDISNYCCAGCRDLYIETIDYKKQVGLDNDLYINAGVILFNLKKFRQENYVQKLLDNNLMLQDKIQFQDQDVINITFKNNIKEVSSIYNFCSSNMHDESNSLLQAIILHYTGAIKPWDKNYKGKCKEDWYKYHKLYLDILKTDIEKRDKEIIQLKKELNIILKKQCFSNIIHKLTSFKKHKEV